MPAHQAHETVKSLKAETPGFSPPALWLLNSPGLSPVDYTVWSVMQENVRQHRFKDVGEFLECIMSAWDELDQRLIDIAVRRLHAAARRKAATLNTACPS